jgi:putative drug exporter of the RND superfamily
VLEYADGSPLAPERIDAMYDLSRWLAQQPGVTGVTSAVDLDPSITREQYRQLGSAPAELLPPSIQEALRQLSGPRIALLVVDSSDPAASDRARALVRTIRQSHPRVDGRLLVTGHTAFDVDFIAQVRENAPRAVALIVLATYVVLFLLLGSIVLPIKAVLMNFLSISASYGALVWIFQDGHLAGWLNFVPGPIETATPLIMFCVLFGLSMDYGVLLLSRIREEYQRTGDNAAAVGAGLERTGRLITAAAAIMAAIFFGFARADLVVVKAIGIGMGIAVVLDATVVRALLVPATMRLLGDWNWWVPRPLARLQERLGLG